MKDPKNLARQEFLKQLLLPLPPPPAGATNLPVLFLVMTGLPPASLLTKVAGVVVAVEKVGEVIPLVDVSCEDCRAADMLRGCSSKIDDASDRRGVHPNANDDLNKVVAVVVAPVEEGDDVMTELTNEDGGILSLNCPSDENDDGKGFG